MASFFTGLSKLLLNGGGTITSFGVLLSLAISHTVCDMSSIKSDTKVNKNKNSGGKLTIITLCLYLPYNVATLFIFRK